MAVGIINHTRPSFGASTRRLSIRPFFSSSGVGCQRRLSRRLSSPRRFVMRRGSLLADTLVETQRPPRWEASHPAAEAPGVMY
jgi:hypothetical protein